MFLSESLRVRQLGVVVFKARDFMDSLDGFVARASKKQVSMYTSSRNLYNHFRPCQLLKTLSMLQKDTTVCHISMASGLTVLALIWYRRI